jgi:hypothetical protein
MKDGKVFSEKRPIFLNPEQESEIKIAFGDVSLNRQKKITTEFVSIKDNYLFSVEDTSNENTMNLSKHREDKELISVVNSNENSIYFDLFNFIINNNDYYYIFLNYIKNRSKMNIIDYLIKPVIINLDEREDRLENIINEFNKMKINNYEKFSAIKIKDHNNLDLIINKYKCWKKMNMEYIKLATGCKLSHLEVLKKYKNCNYQYILIIEDDAIFEKNTFLASID